ncbi:MAG: YihY/virulence factor BrkB family protein [Microbacterium sp.]|uniref:YihY/virulence factor BrkB family protein n=1 Tax=Microbacterium sp. TaxID=51671 RepID=UPI0039E54A8A
MSSETTPVKRLVAWALRRRPVRAVQHYFGQNGPMLADSITYRTLFSVFAGVLLGFSLAGLWLAGNPDAFQALTDAVDAAIPGLVGADGLIDPATVRAPVGLSLAGAVSLVGLVSAATGAIGSLRIALRVLSGMPRADVFVLWAALRNLVLAIAIGAGLGASAAATFLGTAFLGTVQGWLGLTSALAGGAAWALGVVVTFLLDAGVIALLFAALSGRRPRPRALWPGVLLGAAGLTVLQQLSGLFVGGASANPLLASFASLIALLLWFNLSAQVILIAASYIVVGPTERDDDRLAAPDAASSPTAG